MPANAFEYFLAHKQRQTVELLENNEDVAGFMAALLDHLVAYANAEGIHYRQIRLDRPFVTADGQIVAQIRRSPA